MARKFKKKLSTGKYFCFICSFIFLLDRWTACVRSCLNLYLCCIHVLRFSLQYVIVLGSITWGRMGLIEWFLKGVGVKTHVYLFYQQAPFYNPLFRTALFGFWSISFCPQGCPVEKERKQYIGNNTYNCLRRHCVTFPVV